MGFAQTFPRRHYKLIFGSIQCRNRGKRKWNEEPIFPIQTLHFFVVSNLLYIISSPFNGFHKTHNSKQPLQPHNPPLHLKSLKPLFLSVPHGDPSNQTTFNALFTSNRPTRRPSRHRRLHFLKWVWLFSAVRVRIQSE